MFRFQHPYLLYLFALIAVLLVVFLIFYRWKQKQLKNLASKQVLQQILPDFSKSKATIKSILGLLALSFLIIAMANPQMGSKQQEVKKKGIDIVIALDVSNSMMAEDLSPNRLERSKRAILQMINRLGNDRICIIVFGGQSYVQLPLTTDYAAAKLFINTIHTGLIPTQGTAIGSAINLGVQSLDLKSPTQKAIIVITDGENHEDDAITAAQGAAEQGIFVHTIGMGSELGAPIPLYKGKRKLPGAYRKDKEGQTVTTRLNQEMLEEIASAGKGSFIRASNSNSGLNMILKELNKLEKTEFGTKVYTDYDDYFQVFLAIALILFLLEFITSKRRFEWAKKLNLFSNE